MAEILIKNFAQISKADTEIAGGKGASLGAMTQAGIPVPDGFVILSNVFDRFIEETDLNVEIDAVLDSVNIKEVHTVENASEKIQAMILSREMPEDIKTEILKFYKKLDCKFVAVRSSATSEDSASAAWAGQLDSFLNTTDKTLLENVKKCWASLFTPRAIFYRFEKKLNKDNISVAVVVQKMVDSEESGIAFSVHPVTQDENQIIIEAGFGLGEAIVSGSITPDSYVIDKQGFNILDININEQTKALYKKAKGGNEWKKLGEKGKKQVLTEKEIIELSKLIVKIENHYGFPCDIEWAKENGKFYVVQSRPITTLSNNKPKMKVFTRAFSRPYPLTMLSAYNDGMNLFEKAFGYTTNPLFLYKKDRNLVEVYFQQEELNKLFFEMGKYASSEENFKQILKKFKESLNSIDPFLKGKRKVEKTELLRLYDLFMEFYEGIAYMWVLPRLEHIKKGLREEAMKLREETEKLSSQRDNLFIDILSKLYPKIGEKTRFIFLREVLSGASEKELLKKIKERSKGFLFYNKTIITFEKINSFLRDNHIIIDIESNYDKKTSSIKGTTAHPGKIKGKVKVVYTAKDLNKIERGDILVSPMTRPEFILAMKKASAFITDEGGITCHAAIVSREMGKPCIIGTKNATDILKDEDLIEVDANQGIVKILKKTK